MKLPEKSLQFISRFPGAIVGRTDFNGIAVELANRGLDMRQAFEYLPPLVEMAVLHLLKCLLGLCGEVLTVLTKTVGHFVKEIFVLHLLP
jgi:hypothetical protein